MGEVNSTKKMYEVRGKRIDEVGKNVALIDQKIEVLLSLATKDLPSTKASVGKSQTAQRARRKRRAVGGVGAVSAPPR